MVVLGSANDKTHSKSLKDIPASKKATTSIQDDLNSIQTSMFQKQLSVKEVLNLSPMEKNLYFKALENLSKKRNLKKANAILPANTLSNPLERETSIESLVKEIVVGIDECKKYKIVFL